MRSQRLRFPVLLAAVFFFELAGAQSPTAQSPSPPQAQTLAQKPGAVTISLDDAIQMALQHNHNLLAARTTIQQNEAEETTANLRPNPVLLGDSQFLPIFQPSQFSSDYIDNTAQFDLGVSYLFERGKKRQHRLQAAKDADRRDALAGGRQRAQPYLQRCLAVHQRRTCRIDAGAGQRGPEELSEHGGHHAKRATKRATSARTIC